MPFAHEKASIGELKALFSSLPPADASMCWGFFRASFVGPAWLRLFGRPTVEMAGLRGWQGKRFLTAVDATNVLKRGGMPVEALAMRVTPGTSRVDGKQGVALHYVPENGRSAPMPWRRVCDELRAVDENTILAFTVIDLPVLRRMAFPFLLTREG